MGFSGDGGTAILAQFKNPYSVAIDSFGTIYVADVDNERIRKIDVSGNITTIARNGSAGFAGDGSSATLASLNEPIGVAVDINGNILIADGCNNRIRWIDKSGIINTIAGNGTSGFGGDGGQRHC